MKNILITGGLGFIGFNAVQLWKKIRPEYNYVIVDNLTYAGKFKIEDKKKWLKENQIEFFQQDICDINAIKQIIELKNIDTIVNFAAESHVDNSINDPMIFYKVNALGVACLLEAIKDKNIRFHQISTDEVIGSISPEDVYQQNFIDHKIADENAKFNPSSPYSSSKAAGELFCLSHYKTFNTKITISRCTNNFGPWQHTEKMIPTIILNVLNNKKIPIYGNGLQRRFWIYVDEHNKAVMNILENGNIGQTYNIAPKYNGYKGQLDHNKDSLMTNIQLTKNIISILKPNQNFMDFVSYVKDRPAHDTCYFLIADKIKFYCGYEDKSDLFECLNKTVNWYKENFNE